MIRLALLALAVVVLLFTMTLLIRRRPGKLKTQHYQQRWKELQKMCADKTNWSHAVHDADKLLDEALKKKRVGGKSMGERLVRAQRLLSDNDGVWFGHKLRKKIEAEPEVNLKEGEVKDALVGIRQALKDLGALPKNSKSTSEEGDS